MKSFLKKSLNFYVKGSNMEFYNKKLENDFWASDQQSTPICQSCRVIGTHQQLMRTAAHLRFFCWPYLFTPWICHFTQWICNIFISLKIKIIFKRHYLSHFWHISLWTKTKWCKILYGLHKEIWLWGRKFKQGQKSHIKFWNGFAELVHIPYFTY